MIDCIFISIVSSQNSSMDLGKASVRNNAWYQRLKSGTNLDSGGSSDALLTDFLKVFQYLTVFILSFWKLNYMHIVLIKILHILFKVNGCYSTFVDILYEAPQDSILGSPFFKIYIF